MPLAGIGRWRFHVPDGWELKDRPEAKGSHLDAPDGTQGMYVKSIELGTPKDSARELAEYLQQIHQQTFEKLSPGWRVVDRRDSSDGALYRSALDMFDQNASYRLLSVVVADTQEAVQVTLHHYLCEDYPSAKESFASIERSIERTAVPPNNRWRGP